MPHTFPTDRRAPWPWPWHAMEAGATHDAGGMTALLSVIECGELNLPSGELVACDPFADLHGEGSDPWIDVPPGRYPVRVTLADVSEEHDGSHMREAYVSLIIKNKKETRREQLCLLGEGGTPATLENEYAFWGFGVDAGTVCFTDRQAIASDMPPREDWEGLFEGDEGSWFGRMDDPDHIRDGIANIPLPGGDGSTNLVLSHSGWGDGFYPVIAGFDAEGELVAVHIDLLVVGGPPDEDEVAQEVAGQAIEDELEEWRGALRRAYAMRLAGAIGLIVVVVAGTAIASTADNAIIAGLLMPTFLASWMFSCIKGIVTAHKQYPEE